MKIEELEKRVARIEARNRKVEADKGWETSWARRMVIFVSTYVVLATYMWAIEVERPMLNAIVPSVGFWLSTLSLPYFRNRWLKRKRGGGK